MQIILARLWLLVFAAAWLAISCWGSAHAILSKRDPRSALSWTGLIWLVPYLGALLYLLFGINRVERRALRLRAGTPRYRASGPEGTATVRLLGAELPPNAVQLAVLVRRVTKRPLVAGNRVSVLENGDEAYPAMLAAIDAAAESVWLLSYIFDDSSVGRTFIEALGRARERGLQVRVLIDDAGSIDTDADRLLRDRGVIVERFLPVRFSWRASHFNLRNHRKLLVVDGKIGFTGGMNIHVGHVLAGKPEWPVRDVHFRVDGGVVAHLREAFAEDWEFTTGEALDTEAELERGSVGSVVARGVVDGPDERMGPVHLTLVGALACATRSVRIVTPYFLPDQAIILALRVAGLRGVQIDIVLPERSDVRIVDFAARAQLAQVIGPGVRVWYGALPF
ncbi:MAG TPA: phospholipase D-like domain-containing protein, partial [Polyangiaceae bacterium]|nr:phospholipase D-like domain-containing protein [Polyangiaceae bacterium]